VYDIVRQNTQRGVGRDLIETAEGRNLFRRRGQCQGARQAGVSSLVRIAEQEKITVTQEEALQACATTGGMMYQMPFDQFIKDLQKRNGVNELYDQVLHEKVLDLLEKNAVDFQRARRHNKHNLITL
jgi:hypothetical protein